ncbi:hypothetical protein NKJ55_28530 [Mesorhizobium sp. M0106]|uniref:hypothetical protein n=1 Tax=Mesorhizobium sp. M0106 TaxID=2956880 RepID=UPI003334CC91
MDTLDVDPESEQRLRTALPYSRAYGTPSMAGALARERRIISATIAATWGIINIYW